MRAIAIVALLAATPAWAAERAVLLMERPGWQREEALLIEALRIYTRDLGVLLELGLLPHGVEPPDPADSAGAAAARCAPNTALVLWFAGAGQAPSLFGLRCASRELRSAPMMPVDDPELAAQTLALKVRDLLVRERVAERDGWHTESMPPGQARPAPPAATPTSNGPRMAPNQATAGPASPAAGTPIPTESDHDVTSAPAAGPARSTATPTKPTPTKAAPTRGYESALGWGFDWGGGSWLRHGVAIRLAVPWPHRLVTIELDTAMTVSFGRVIEGYRVAVGQLPLGLALPMRFELGRWTLAVGPRAALHFLAASASSPDGRTGNQVLISAGLGAIGRLQWRLSPHLALELMTRVEALLPRRELTIDGQDGIDMGQWQCGVAIGGAYVF